MQYFHTVWCFAEQDFEREANERYDSYIAMLLQGRRALGSALDARDHCAEPLFEFGKLPREVTLRVGQDVIKVSARALREDDCHGLRYFAKVASTSSAVANLPSAASRNPLSTPRSSSSAAI